MGPELFIAMPSCILGSHNLEITCALLRTFEYRARSASAPVQCLWSWSCAWLSVVKRLDCEMHREFIAVPRMQERRKPCNRIQLRIAQKLGEPCACLHVRGIVCVCVCVWCVVSFPPSPTKYLCRRSWWPRDLKRGSAAVRLLGSWVRILPGYGCLSNVSVVL
jgi:hypothetical protein